VRHETVITARCSNQYSARSSLRYRSRPTGISRSTLQCPGVYITKVAVLILARFITIVGSFMRRDYVGQCLLIEACSAHDVEARMYFHLQMTGWHDTVSSYFQQLITEKKGPLLLMYVCVSTTLIIPTQYGRSCHWYLFSSLPSLCSVGRA
jgi:hypothetical protein